MTTTFAELGVSKSVQDALATRNINAPFDIQALVMLQNLTTMVNEDRTQALFNLTQKQEGKDIHLGTEGLKFYTSFADPRSPNYSWNTEAGDSVEAFASGRAVMMVGYAYGIDLFYDVPSFIPMALPTALAFAVLSVGLLCARPDRGLMAVITSEGAGGLVVRGSLRPQEEGVGDRSVVAAQDR